MDNSINFTAKFIQTSKVQKLSNRFYKNFDASFVELNRKDLNALEETTKEWDEIFSNAITNNAKNKLRHYKTKFHVYALTTQKENFAELQPKKILGLVEYQEGLGCDEINLLQVNPKYKNYERNFIDKLVNIIKGERVEYKNSGKSILDSLKSIYKNRRIDVDSATAATGFYEKNGFKSIYKNGTNYTWRNKKSR